MRLILASASPRRRELLTAASYKFDILPPDDDAEVGLCSNCGPAELVAELAGAKAANVVRKLKESGQWAVDSLQADQCNSDRTESTELLSRRTIGTHANPPTDPQSQITNPNTAIVLAADTVAECDGHILGKPVDEDNARQMLQMLSGRKHRVYTGVCLWRTGAGGPTTRVAVTSLRLDKLTEMQIDVYLATGGWQGKAGAFGFQDRLDWIHIVDGSESNVVGLPMKLVDEMLQEAGFLA